MAARPPHHASLITPPLITHTVNPHCLQLAAHVENGQPPSMLMAYTINRLSLGDPGILIFTLKCTDQPQ